MDENRQEAVYLVDRDFLLHLKEVRNNSFSYTVFDKETKGRVSEGRISEDEVMNWIDPTHDTLAAAREAAIAAAKMDGIKVAQVGLTSLKDFSDSDIRRRSIWEPETLPTDDIRFIDSQYNELFRIPNGGTIEVEYPDHTFSAKCSYIDDYHVAVSGDAFHICQLAEIMERNGGGCRPEPESCAEQAAWKIGQKHYLAVEFGAGHWDCHLFDSNFTELKNGELEVLGCSINEVRDLVLRDCHLDRRSMTPTDHDVLMEKAAKRKEETRGEKRESVMDYLSALKSSQNDRPAPEKKRPEPSR